MSQAAFTPGKQDKPYYTTTPLNCLNETKRLNAKRRTLEALRECKPPPCPHFFTLLTLLGDS